jgi:enediyne biosynthesis protein E4
VGLFVKSKVVWIVAGLILIAVGITVWMISPEESTPPRSFLFRESASEVGIHFQMKFLPQEQGETFKINLYDHGCGLAVGDFDGDGHDDIYFVNQLGPNALYRNKGDGHFEDVTVSAGIALADRICVAATFVDYDNDEKLDLYVTSTRGGNVLFRNIGNGKFEDVTKVCGLTHIGHSQTALFFDYDRDGFLDLFLANTAEWTTNTFDPSSHYYVGKGGDGFGQVVHSPKESNVLYRNNGKGGFEEVTEKAGLKGAGWAGDAVAFDYNEDGFPDLLVTSMFGRSQLYQNNTNGTFTDVTLKVLGRTPWGGLGARVFDFNNDGKLDLFIVDMHSDMWMGPDFKHISQQLAKRSERKKFGWYNGPNVESKPHLIGEEMTLAREIGFSHQEVIFGNAFFRNEGNGKFSEISDEVGLETFWPWGISTGDFDNDGYEDLFLPSGMGYPFYYWPNYLLMNDGQEKFLNKSEEAGIEPPVRGIHLSTPIAGKQAARSSRSAATADFDGDGRLELVVNNFNDQPYFFKNQYPQKNYVSFRLQGTKSNRDAIGAIVRLHQGKKIMTRQVLAACGYLTQSSRTVHFGLGDQTTIDKVEILWPSGERQELTQVDANRRHDVVEPGVPGKK